MIPKNSTARNVLFYVLTLLTGGSFALIWVFTMAYEAEKKGARLFRGFRLYAGLFFLLYIVYLFATLYGVYQFFYADSAWIEKNIFYMATVSALLLIGAANIMFKIADFIRARSISIPSNAALVFIMFACAFTLPLLQFKLNLIYKNDT